MRRLAGTLASAAAGYLIGTLPSADIVTRLATAGQLNIREEGTGNSGAANVAGVLGKKWGAVVMVADVAKGIAAAKVGGRLGGRHEGLLAGRPSLQRTADSGRQGARFGSPGAPLPARADADDRSLVWPPFG